MADRGQGRDWASSMLRRYETETEALTTEGCLEKIANWCSRGSLRQFRVEAEGQLAGSEYMVQMEDDGLQFYRTRREGGFLGIGARTVREPVLRIIQSETGVEIAPEPRDPAFIAHLASALQHH